MKMKPINAGGDPLGYVMGELDWKGTKRPVPPEIVDGSLARFLSAFDPAFGHASIVCSFSERLEDLQMRKLEEFMEATGRFMMPGVRRQAWEALWVLHVRKNGSVDLHGLYLLTLLSSGKSIPLLSARRGDLRHLFAYQEWANCHFGFSSPMELERGRIREFPPHRLPAKNKELFSAVDEAVSGAFEDGLINDRGSVVDEIRKRGYLVTREDKHSITVADDSGTRVKLKNFKYQRDFTRARHELKRAEWVRIHAMPQARREKLLAAILESARAERTQLLSRAIRTAQQPGPFLIPRNDLQSSGEPETHLVKSPREIPLKRGSPTHIFTSRLQGHLEVHGLAPALASLGRDLPQLLPPSAAHLQQWTALSSLILNASHEKRNEPPKPDTRLGRTAPEVARGNPEPEASGESPTRHDHGTPADSRREQQDLGEPKRQERRAWLSTPSAWGFAIDCGYFAQAAKELINAVKDLEEFEAQEAKRKAIIELFRNATRFDRPNIEPSI